MQKIIHYRRLMSKKKNNALSKRRMFEIGQDSNIEINL